VYTSHTRIRNDMLKLIPTPNLTYELSFRKRSYFMYAYIRRDCSTFRFSLYPTELGQQSARLNFAELNAVSNQFARGIVELAGAKNDDGDFVVAVQLPPSDGLIAILLAVWKAGAAYLPVDMVAPTHRIRHVIDEAKPCLVITGTPESKRYTITRT